MGEIQPTSQHVKMVNAQMQYHVEIVNTKLSVVSFRIRH